MNSKLCLISFAQRDRLRNGTETTHSLEDMQVSANATSGQTGSLCTRLIKTSSSLSRRAPELIPIYLTSNAGIINKLSGDSTPHASLGNDEAHQAESFCLIWPSTKRNCKCPLSKMASLRGFSSIPDKHTKPHHLGVMCPAK